MPRQTRNFSVVSLERSKFPHGPNVVQLNELVARGRQEPIPIIIPSHFGNGILVSIQCTKTGRTARIPEFDQIVFGSTGHNGRARVPVHRLDIPSMAFQNPLFGMRGPVPDADGGVIPATDKFGIRGRKGKRVNGLISVRIDGLYWRDAGRPVFNVAAGIAREEIISIVRPGHGAKRSLVSTHDEFETKVDFGTEI